MLKLYVPYNGKAVITSPYGSRTDPFTGAAGWHSGVDLVGQGDKTILAPCDGVVGTSTMLDQKTDTTHTWEWGNYVRIDADDGYTKVYLCHMSKRLVTAGQRVKRGEPIGIEGSTGRSTGSHCHFEVRQNNIAVNPCLFLICENKAGTVLENEMPTVQKEWWTDAVNWAVENGILLGDGNGDLMLDEPCTRRQMAVFLYRMAGLK